MALRWLVEKPLVLPIPGTKNDAQARSNSGALSFSLTANEVAVDEATLAWMA